MSRFVNLEFQHDSEGESRNESGRNDEAFHLGEAWAAFERAAFDPALRSFSKVLEFNPQNTAAWCGQVRALIELGEFREARLWSDKALERFPRDPELLAAKAVALGRSGDLDAALAFSDAAIEERGDTPYIWLARGDVLLARQEKRAEYCFAKAQTLAPKNWFITWLAARIRFFYQQFSLALKLAQQAVEWNPGHAVPWVLLGLCQKEVGLTAPARVSLEQALQLDPQIPEATEALRNMATAGAGARIHAWWKQLFHNE
jgi:Flp pilus assembly protein TadD